MCSDLPDSVNSLLLSVSPFIVFCLYPLLSSFIRPFLNCSLKHMQYFCMIVLMNITQWPGVIQYDQRLRVWSSKHDQFSLMSFFISSDHSRSKSISSNCLAKRRKLEGERGLRGMTLVSWPFQDLSCLELIICCVVTDQICNCALQTDNRMRICVLLAVCASLR